MAPASSTASGPTIYQVATVAGVSTATVSRALAHSDKVRPSTRDRVLAAAHELGYVPEAAARALAGRRTRALGAVLPHMDGAYYSELLVGFELAASALGMSVVIDLAHPDTDPRAFVRDLAGRVDAVAFMARSSVTSDLIREVASTRPVITVARPEVDGCDALFSENHASARALTAHLIAHGRTRLGFAGPLEHGSDIAARYAGFLDALASAGLAEAAHLDVEPMERGGHALAHDLLARGDLGTANAPFDAIVCGNDEIALALTHTLTRAGVSVPGDLAVTGWDNTITARYLTPTLTSVQQPVADLGRRAAELLVARLTGAPVGPSITLPAEPIYRGSCGCPDTDLHPAPAPAAATSS